MIKHRRTPGSSSDPYMPFKRVLQSDVIQDSGSDVIGRPPKMKVAKSKSDKGGVDFSSPKYASLASYGKIPKRSKAKNDKGEKLLVSKLPRSDDRLLLERRSRTFVVESHERLLDEGHQRTRTKELRISNVPSKLETFTNRKPPKPPVSKDSSQHTPSSKEHVSNRTVAHEELTSKGTNQWQERRGESRINQWEVETEALREGARNPMNSGSYLPARPKSAGQLRYYDSDDSDESSLGGEIEIVDIDKELENDPEPSPYWSEAPPLQIPEVHIHTNPSTNSTPRKDHRNNRSSVHLESRQQQQSQSSFSSKQESTTLQQPPSWSSRQRHDSGESDLSTFSDSLVKPAPPNGRRRFMSEPEILNLDDHRLGLRKHGKKKKGGQVLPESDFRENDVIEASTSSLARASRERLYSDTMERMMSRYSEMGVRELNEDISRKGRPSRIPVGNASSSQITSGHAPPPRKLKPILKQPRYDANNSS
ncbi:hypothetical protein V1264_017648 [Littorina saxatilis]|uniref:Uncharacterized protein n=1 Tax=Littorina saxatilis TaxID=31220 RepID=A0AAN9GET8_9CAEN